MWEGDDGNVRRMLTDFFDELCDFRCRCEYMGLGDFLRYCLDRTGYMDAVSVMPFGGVRRANLEKLAGEAVKYESSNEDGLFGFLAHLSELNETGEYFAASADEEGEAVVRIVSIHKSKGLEYPIVFLFDASAGFNKEDIKNPVLMHKSLGIALNRIDVEERTRTPSFFVKAVSNIKLEEMYAEEQRLLYVAMTRAKEKLIIVGKLDKTDEKLPLYRLKKRGDRAIKLCVKSENSYLGWILLALSDMPEKYPVIVYGKASVLEMANRLAGGESASGYANEKKQDIDKNIYEELEKRFSFVYHTEVDGQLPLKVSVSAIKHKALDEEDEPETLYQPDEPYVPNFIRSQSPDVGGAVRGSAMHRFLQLHDFRLRREDVDLKSEADKLVESGRLERDAERLLNYSKLKNFMETDAYDRMSAAALKGQLYREQPFVIAKSADELGLMESDEIVLVQGIIDAFWVEDDGICLLDYKTDIVKDPSELTERYGIQLFLYADALRMSRGARVKNIYIYSFGLGSLIDVWMETKG